MSWIPLLIYSFIVFSFLLDQLVERLNLNQVQKKLPRAFEGIYSESEYRRSQTYLKESTQYALFQKALFLPLVIGFLSLDGLVVLDRIVSQWRYGPIESGLLYLGILAFGLQILKLPFSYYQTFSIEERYGFNRSTKMVFFLDWFKALLIGVFMGALLLGLLLWFLMTYQKHGWWMAGVVIIGLQLFFALIAPVWIMPLFNRFSPLPEGELREKIEAFSNQVGFQIGGIYTMDGSRRSTKANAFFTGFGKTKRIVLFDTLIQKLSTDELVAVLAHEIGHYQRHHIFKMMALSVVTIGLTLFAFQWMLYDLALYRAFGFSEIKIHIGLVLVSFLFAPLSRVFGVLSQFISRRHEYEADAYAVKNYEKPFELVSALKKLTVDHLGNLNPHRMKVWFDYSHPPVLKRIQAIENASLKDEATS